MELLHKELTYKIRHCIFEVRKEIGAGFDEETYHQGLILSFELNALPFVSKERRALMHRGMAVRYFVNDFLLFDKIVLSVKCMPCKFLRAHYVQLFSELKLWGKDLLGITALQEGVDQSDVANMQSYLKFLHLNTGIVANFGKSKVNISAVRAPIRETSSSA